MYARLTVIAAALAVGASAFAAEPVKTRDAQPAQPSRPAAVVLASAEEIGEAAPASDQPAAPVKRPRVARVTTCRCGDQQAQDQQ